MTAAPSGVPTIPETSGRIVFPTCIFLPTYFSVWILQNNIFETGRALNLGRFLSSGGFARSSPSPSVSLRRVGRDRVTPRARAHVVRSPGPFRVRARDATHRRAVSPRPSRSFATLVPRRAPTPTPMPTPTGGGAARSAGTRGLLEHAVAPGENAWGDAPRFSWEAPGGVDRASSGPEAHVLFPPERLHEVRPATGDGLFSSSVVPTRRVSPRDADARWLAPLPSLLSDPPVRRPLAGVL